MERRLSKTSGRRTPVAVVLTLLALLEGTVLGFGAPRGTDGTIEAWGRNSKGQVGREAAAGDPIVSPAQVEPLEGITAVSAGYDHSVALKADGTVWAWGSTKDGALGNGALCDRESTKVANRQNNPEDNCTDASGASIAGPVQVKTDNNTFLTGVKQVAAGYFHNLALRSDGTVWAWGRNCSAQLGFLNGGGVNLPGITLNASPYAVKVPGLPRRIEKLSAGAGHSLALDEQHVLWSWGASFYGQLGRFPNQQDPAETAGKRSGSCIDRFGNQPGGPEGQHGSFLPAPAMIPSPVVDMAAGSDHTLALTADGNVWAFGNNCNGQLGFPRPSVPEEVMNAKRGRAPMDAKRATPLPVLGLPTEDRVVSLAAGGFSVKLKFPGTGTNAPPVDGWFEGGHSLALTQSGKVYGWGLPDSIGKSADKNSSSCPLPTNQSDPALESLRQTVVGVHAVPEIVIDSTDDRPSNIAAISGAVFSSLAVKTDGTLVGWGRNDSAQLGPNATQVATSPVTIPLEGETEAVSARSHTLVLLGTPPGRPACRGICPISPPDLSGVVGDVARAIDDTNEQVDENRPSLLEDGSQPPPAISVPLDLPHVPGPELPLAGSAGAVFVAGSDADHVAGSSSCEVRLPGGFCARDAARHFTRRAVAYVTPGRAAPRLLYIPGVNEWGLVKAQTVGNPSSTEAQKGIQKSGFSRCSPSGAPSAAPGCFDYALNLEFWDADCKGIHVSSRQPWNNYEHDRVYCQGAQDLRTVDFNNYDAVLVGSGLYPPDLWVLEDRQKHFEDYVNSGHGLAAFAQFESYKPQLLPPDRSCRNRSGEPNRGNACVEYFRFLPFLRERQYSTAEIAASYYTGTNRVTDRGRESGFTETSMNSARFLAWFPESCGFEILGNDQFQRIIAMGTRNPIPSACSGVSVPAVSVVEGNSGTRPMTFQVTLNSTQAEPQTLQFETADGTATVADRDYVPTRGSLTFGTASRPHEPGSQPVTVQVTGDANEEPDESVLLKFTDSTGAVFTTTGTILDDDTVLLAPDELENSGAGLDNSVRLQDPDAFLGLDAPTGEEAGAPTSALAVRAPAAAQTVASQAGTQGQAQAQTQAQAVAQSAAHGMQVVIMGEKEKQEQIERAYLDNEIIRADLLASARQPGPLLPVLAFAFAAITALGLGFMRRVASIAMAQEASPAEDDSKDAPPALSLRRKRSQR